jgi:hypothetical protein
MSTVDIWAAVLAALMFIAVVASRFVARRMGKDRDD